MRAALAVLVRAAIRLPAPYPVLSRHEPWRFAAGLAAAVARGTLLDVEDAARILETSGKTVLPRRLARAAIAVDAVAKGQIGLLDAAPDALRENDEAAAAVARAVVEMDAGVRHRAASRQITWGDWSRAAWERDLARALKRFPRLDGGHLGAPVEFALNGPFGEVWPWECDPEADTIWGDALRFLPAGAPLVGTLVDADDDLDAGGLGMLDVLVWYSVESDIAEVPARVDELFPDGLAGIHGPRLMAYAGSEPPPYDTEVELLRRGVRLLLPEDFGGDPPADRREFFTRLRQLLVHASLGIGPEHRPASEPSLTSLALFPALDTSRLELAWDRGGSAATEPDAADGDEEDDDLEPEMTEQQLARADAELASLVSLAAAPLPWDRPLRRGGPTPEGPAPQPKRPPSGRRSGPGW